MAKSQPRQVIVNDKQALRVRDHVREGQELSSRHKSASAAELSAWIQKAVSLLLMLDAKVATPSGDGILSHSYWELVQRVSDFKKLEGDASTRTDWIEAAFLQSLSTFQVIGDCIDVSPENLVVTDDKQLNPYFPSKAAPVEPYQVFVLMPFNEPWSNRIWQSHLKPIVEGLETDPPTRCLRADDLYGHDVLLDIHRMIQTSHVIIADITSRNANVFYELGIAHAIGKKVVLMSQSTKDIPFDLLRFRHILYEDNSDGYARLSKQIQGALLEALA